jgi:hypothetical protein
LSTGNRVFSWQAASIRSPAPTSRFNGTPYERPRVDDRIGDRRLGSIVLASTGLNRSTTCSAWLKTSPTSLPQVLPLFGRLDNERIAVPMTDRIALPQTNGVGKMARSGEKSAATTRSQRRHPVAGLHDVNGVGT